MGGYILVPQQTAADRAPLRQSSRRESSGLSEFRESLQYMRASGLAQARLQLAVLSGNRRGALREIDRLVEIDRQLEWLANGQPAAEAPCGESLQAHLSEQQRAIASEKLVLTAAVEFPRIAARQREDDELLLGQSDEVEVVEDAELGKSLSRVLLWSLAAVLLCVAISLGVAVLSSYRLLPLG